MYFIPSDECLLPSDESSVNLTNHVDDILKTKYLKSMSVTEMRELKDNSTIRN